MGHGPTRTPSHLQLAILPWYSDGLVLKSKFLSVYHKPERLNWSMSCMSRCPKTYWAQINRGVLQNGHIRVGYEDCGKHPDGSYAASNADLVDRVVQMAKLVGRPIATAEEAREIIGLRQRN